jgi:hypothetical protein
VSRQPPSCFHQFSCLRQRIISTNLQSPPSSSNNSSFPRCWGSPSSSFSVAFLIAILLGGYLWIKQTRNRGKPTQNGGHGSSKLSLVEQLVGGLCDLKQRKVEKEEDQLMGAWDS